MALVGARLLGLVSLASSLVIGCGAGPVELRATQTCEGGNLDDCKNRCGKNEGMPCYKLGWMHERGREIPKSFDEAMALYQKSCESGWPQACRVLGDFYWRAERVKLNRKKALEYWERACALGLTIACPTQLERDIADGKLVAISRGNGAVSVVPKAGYATGSAPSVSTSSPATMPSEPSAPAAPGEPSVPAAP